MGIMIILVLLLIIGIVLLVIGAKTYSDVDTPGILMTLVFGWAVFICSIVIIVNQATADYECEKMQERRNAIEYRLEQIDKNDSNILVNGGIYDDIVEYNNDVRRYKMYRASFWTNWFVSDGLDEFEYIEYNIDK